MPENHEQQKSHVYDPAQVYDVGSESPRRTTTEYTRYSLFSPTEWLVEILTAISSLVLLAAIAVMIRYVDGKPISAWSDRISLNAVISVMTTACSAALMDCISESISQLKWLHFKNGPQKLGNFEKFEKFDGASRGSWGSFKFMTTVK